MDELLTTFLIGSIVFLLLNTTSCRGLKCFKCLYQEVDGESLPGSDQSCMTKPATESLTECRMVDDLPVTCVTISYNGKLPIYNDISRNREKVVKGVVRKCVLSTNRNKNFTEECNKGTVQEVIQKVTDVEVKIELDYLTLDFDKKTTQARTCSCNSNKCNWESVDEEDEIADGGSNTNSASKVQLYSFVALLGTCIIIDLI